MMVHYFSWEWRQWDCMCFFKLVYMFVLCVWLAVVKCQMDSNIVRDELLWQFAMNTLQNKEKMYMYMFVDDDDVL